MKKSIIKTCDTYCKWKILDVEKLANRISEETGYSGRSIVLGHIQRGGSPVPEDRILASKMAEEAICLLEKEKVVYVSVWKIIKLYLKILKKL